MGNTIDAYNPIFYAQEALILLEKALGMAGRIHRGYDQERRSFRRGQIIEIKKPSTFTAENAPSTAQDLDTSYLQLSLDYWKEVKFGLTDRELAFTGEQIINDHIRPAAYALADDIDQKLCTLYKFIPWYYTLVGTLSSPKVLDITGPRRVMFDNAVPLTPGDMHYMADGELEEILLNSPALMTSQGAGTVGVDTQLRGHIGTRYGLEIFANQNVQTHTGGSLTVGSGTLALSSNVSKGATSITISATALSGTLVSGDTLVIAGNSQRYSVTNSGTASGNSITPTIFPPLVQDYSSGAAVVIDCNDYVANIAFHRNAFALATAPLSEIGNELGAKIATVTDPITGLSIRSRLFYVGDSSEVKVSLDVLYGLRCLDANLACRAIKVIT